MERYTYGIFKILALLVVPPYVMFKSASRVTGAFLVSGDWPY